MGQLCDRGGKTFKIPKTPVTVIVDGNTNGVASKAQVNPTKKYPLPVSNIIYEKTNIGVQYDNLDESVEYLEMKVSLKDFVANSFDFYSVKIEIENEIDSQRSVIGITSSEKFNNDINFREVFTFPFNFSVIQNFRFTIIKNKIKEEVCFIKSINKLYANQNLRILVGIPSPLGGKLSLKATTSSKRDLNNISLGISIDFKGYARKNSFRPFFVIKKNPLNNGSIDYDSFTSTVYKSEVFSEYDNGVEAEEEIKYKPFSTNPKILCNEIMDNLILLEVHDHPNQRKIGYLYFKYNQIFENKEALFGIVTLNPEEGEEVVVEGVHIKFNFTKTQRKNAFLDFIKGGVTMAMIIGIDFTSSNGPTHLETSLHTLINPPNHYEQVLKSCQEVVSAYDNDQIFQVYGFGGLLRGQKDVSHCFNVNLGKSANIEKIENVLKAYRKSLTSVTFSGPTFFAPLINQAIENVKKDISERSSLYSILLILTDGIINDMEQTKKAIVESSYLPLSILIVGIGKANFSNMDELDANNEALCTNDGDKACRDCVVFKKFEDYKNNKGKMLGHKLAEDLMRDIPKHIEEFHEYNDINPGESFLKIYRKKN